MVATLGRVYGYGVLSLFIMYGKAQGTIRHDVRVIYPTRET